MAQIERSITSIKEEIKQYKETTAVENQFTIHFTKHRNITELTREVIVELVEMIYVLEGGTITIEFKYQDEYQRLLDLLEERKTSPRAG